MNKKIRLLPKLDLYFILSLFILYVARQSRYENSHQKWVYIITLCNQIVSGKHSSQKDVSVEHTWATWLQFKLLSIEYKALNVRNNVCLTLIEIHIYYGKIWSSLHHKCFVESKKHIQGSMNHLSVLNFWCVARSGVSLPAREKLWRIAASQAPNCESGARTVGSGATCLDTV